MSSLYPAKPYSLICSPSLHHDPRLQGLSLAPMLFTLKIWCTCSTKFSLSLPCSPLSNVLFNPLIPDAYLMLIWHPGLKPFCFNSITLFTLYAEGFAPLAILSLNIISPNIGKKHIFRLNIITLHAPSLILPKPTNFEYLYAQGPHQLHLISPSTNPYMRLLPFPRPPISICVNGHSSASHHPPLLGQGMVLYV